MEQNVHKLLKFDRFALDLTRGCLQTADADVALRPKAFEVLRHLAQNAGRLVSRQELHEAVWPRVAVTDNSVEQCIWELREKLADSDHLLIKTVPRRGYRFDARVTASTQAAVAPMLHVNDRPGQSHFVATAPTQRISIVVLPFRNLSEEPAQEYFGDGITEDLTTDLSCIPESFIIAPGTALAYKGSSVGAKEIGRDLNVRYLVEGSVRRSGEVVRVNVQLSDAATAGVIWSSRFETTRGDLFDVQDQIVGQIVQALDLQLIEAEASRTFRERPDNPDARDLAIRGWSIMNKEGFLPQTCLQCADLFKSALAIERQNVRAMIGLSLAETRLRWGGWSEADTTAHAEALVDAALRLEPQNAHSHFVKAMINTRLKQQFELGFFTSRKPSR